MSAGATLGERDYQAGGGGERRTQEYELRPEIHDAEEWKVCGDAVEEGAEDAGRADVLGGGAVGSFGAGDDVVWMVGAVGLFPWVAERMVAEGLGTIVGVLWGYHHGHGVVDGQGDED